MNNKGLFISIEGPDGSGKSTISKKIAKYLEQKNIPHVLTREPGCYNIDICNQIRNMLLDNKSNINAKTEALLFAANRSEHVEKLIIPAINNNKIVICDRYIDSSIAYQGYARKLGIQNIIDINMFATNNLWPHISFFIDVKPEIGIERIKKHRNDQINRLDNETLSFHNDVYKGYFELINTFPQRFIIIDGNNTIENMFINIINKINDFLKKGDFFINAI